MPAAINLVGQTFGRLLVLELTGRAPRVYRCRCTCGAVIIRRADCLRNKLTRSCGCLKREEMLVRFTKHGHDKAGQRSKEYRAWVNAKSRCIDPTNPHWKYYGGRGIKMCQEWRDDFKKFINHIGICPSGKTLDRIDNNGHYEPGNVRWTSRLVQSRNRRFPYQWSIDGKERIRAALKQRHAQHRT